MKQNNGEFTLKDLLSFILSKIVIVLLCMVIGGYVRFCKNRKHGVAFRFDEPFR